MWTGMISGRIPLRWHSGHTRTDTVRMMMKNIVDSCQILIDSALLYSPDQYFYYAQKATFYACGLITRKLSMDQQSH